MSARRIALRGIGVNSPAGAGLAAHEQWWGEGRPSCLGPTGKHAGDPYMAATQSGEVPGWRARNHVPDRKSIKLMFPRVQLGIGAALEAWDADGWTEDDAPEPPERRAMYAACGLTVDEDWTFREAVHAGAVDGRFDMVRFGQEGQGLLNPLWLVKGLSNNVLAFVARYRTITGPNDNFMAGAVGGFHALDAAVGELEAGRADRALAGTSDSLVTIEDSLAFARDGALAAGLVPSQGAGFALLTPGEPGDFGILAVGTGFHAGRAEAPWQLPPGTSEALDALAQETRGDLVPALRIRGPRLADAGDIDLWTPLGDPGAAASGWMLAAAWLARTVDRVDGPIELAVADPTGELAVVILGTLP